MKSRFFTDTQGLDRSSLPRDKVSVCLCLNRRAYELLLMRAGRMGLTSGEYIDRLIFAPPVNACGREDRTQSDSQPQRFPPAPPGH